MEREDIGFDGEHTEQFPAVGNPTISTAGSNVAAASTTTSGLERGQTPPGLLPSIAVPGVLPLPPPARPRLRSVVCRPPPSETTPGPPYVPYDRFSYIDMEGFVGQDIPLNGYKERYRMEAWRHDHAFVGGSHERGGTSNASILREHSTSVAAAQRRRHDDQDDGGEQELAERRECQHRSRHYDHRRERDRYGRHDHDRHMRSSTTSYRSEERDDTYSYDHDHDRELGRDRYVPCRIRHTRDDYRHQRDQRYAYDRRDRCRAELRRDRYVPCLGRNKENRGGTDRSQRDQRHASRDRRRRDRHTELGRERSYVPSHVAVDGSEIVIETKERTDMTMDAIGIDKREEGRSEMAEGSSNNQDVIDRHRGGVHRHGIRAVNHEHPKKKKSGTQE